MTPGELTFTFNDGRAVAIPCDEDAWKLCVRFSERPPTQPDCTDAETAIDSLAYRLTTAAKISVALLLRATKFTMPAALRKYVTLANGERPVFASQLKVEESLEMIMTLAFVGAGVPPNRAAAQYRLFRKDHDPLFEAVMAEPVCSFWCPSIARNKLAQLRSRVTALYS